MAIDINAPLQLADGTKVTYVGTTPRGRIQVNIPGGDNNPYLFEQSGEHYKGEQANLMNVPASASGSGDVTFRVNDRYFDDVAAAFAAVATIVDYGDSADVYKIVTVKTSTLIASINA